VPLGPHLLAYIKAGDMLRIVNSDSGELVASSGARAGIETLGWSPDGARLLEATRSSLWLRDVSFGKLISGLELGPARRIPLPPGTAIQSASFSPRDGTIAVLLTLPAHGGRTARSEVVLVDGVEDRPRPLFTAPGHLSDLEWSPAGSHLLIGWPDADQWLFVPSAGIGKVRAVGHISAEFDPGGVATGTFFPRVDGWCCATAPRAAGG
jgi:dipeptidyl aminopeptidase/acylaminoacyl peptidase